jgi:hypothetical protein
LIRGVSRRLERLEARYMASTPGTIEIRVLLVHPENGLMGVLVFATDQPTMKASPTPEEVARVRADLERPVGGTSLFAAKRDFDPPRGASVTNQQ